MDTFSVPCLAEVSLNFPLWQDEKRNLCQVVFDFLSSIHRLTPLFAKWSWYFPVHTFGRMHLNGKLNLAEVSLFVSPEIKIQRNLCQAGYLFTYYNYFINSSRFNLSAWWFIFDGNQHCTFTANKVSGSSSHIKMSRRWESTCWNIIFNQITSCEWDPFFMHG